MRRDGKNLHVTFFFNNYRDEAFPGEDRACPSSPKVATYDLQPEMVADEVTAAAKRPSCRETTDSL